MSPKRSVGQGNLYSKLSQGITSIIKKLTSQSLTGQSLQIQIHNHIGLAVHLIWYVTSNDKNSSRCIERIFSHYMEQLDILNHIQSGAIERLCECVGVRILEWFKDKVEQCRIKVPINLYFKRACDPRSWEATMHKMGKRGKLIQCSCPVSYSYVVYRELVNIDVTDTARDVALRSLLTLT